MPEAPGNGPAGQELARCTGVAIEGRGVSGARFTVAIKNAGVLSKLPDMPELPQAKPAAAGNCFDLAGFIETALPTGSH